MNKTYILNKENYNKVLHEISDDLNSLPVKYLVKHNAYTEYMAILGKIKVSDIGINFTHKTFRYGNKRYDISKSNFFIWDNIGTGYVTLKDEGHYIEFKYQLELVKGKFSHYDNFHYNFFKNFDDYNLYKTLEGIK